MANSEVAPRKDWSPGVCLVPGLSTQERLQEVVKGEFAFVWRTLRRLGVPEADADDGAQRVFLVLSRKLGDVALGHERAFLFSTALRVASEARRTLRRRREDGDREPMDRVDSSLNPEELVERRRALSVLDEVLDSMPVDLRTVFVLCELEELPVPEIASLLQIPVGTASSRLRRARESFREACSRVRARSNTSWRTHE